MHLTLLWIVKHPIYKKNPTMPTQGNIRYARIKSEVTLTLDTSIEHCTFNTNSKT